MSRERLEELIRHHLEGELTAEERRELEEALEKDPDAPRMLRESANEQLLLWETAGRPLPRFAPPRSSFRRLLAAAVLLAAGLGAWFLWPSTRSALEYEGLPLACLEEDGALREVENLSRGARHLVRSGSFRLSENRVEVLAPTVLTLGSQPPPGEREEMSLVAGHVRIRVPPGKPGILVRTPKGTLRDIGTVFELRLNEPTEEQEMIGKLRARALPLALVLLVSSGQVAWAPVRGEERVITPEMGRVSLSDDPSLGRMIDREGLVFVRPVEGERWTLADEDTRLEVGDWLKTGARGANAAEGRLKDGTRFILGPGGLLEVPEANALRLYRGELDLRPAQGKTVRVDGPGGSARQVSDARTLRARDGALELLEKEPRWLAGYKGKASTEAMGSLLANIDGRDEPLTLGYHKVGVDIRDQIARTVVEESFVNHTDAVLEGVFYFPLPQDASISGFAMWIGNELVEADIVEKQRAREIYETILREKRDPGLLEWTGGNIFKARVYPIPARGEKRIRITYTEVLPKEGRRYRYSYALQSELLRLHPLRRLELKVAISSAEKLAAVTCTSHMARVRRTDHAASVEFSAEEYTPTRDFELVVETTPAAKPAAVIPHLRGEDGYFMVLLSGGPSREGRPVIANTEPLDLIIAADTSGSMTEEHIEEQRLFIASLLESLSEKDRFNLIAFDVSAEWAFESRAPVTQENRDRAIAVLERRGALGWTDLDLAFREILARARGDTHVIFVGDGIITTGDADPAAFAARLKRLYRGDGSCHAVAVGSTYELTTLRAMAGLGAGSLHRTGGGKDAAEIAADLLREITSPGLREIRLEWQGLRIARVYPEILPNLPAGRQQIILGRYLPEERKSKGTLRVTGALEGKPVSYEIPLDLSGAEQGNAFIPRFWARLHLDHLLAQGRDPQVVERIIALSEDYQIITPYTSFLVLESDADRQRFKVRKRLRMRGGEEFFAEGRRDATYELARQQMLAARRWRLGIRNQVLKLYEALGWDLRVPEPRSREDTLSWTSSSSVRTPSPRTKWFAAGAPLALDFEEPADAAWAREPAVERFSEALGEIKADLDDFLTFALEDWQGVERGFGALPENEDRTGLLLRPAAPQRRGRFALGRSSSAAGLGFYAGEPFPDFRAPPSPPSPPFGSLFPAPGGVRKPYKGTWPAEVRELVDKLDRHSLVEKLEGGLRIAAESDTIDFRGRTRPHGRASHLISPAAWSSTSASHPGSIPTLRWLDAGKRGALDAARLLGSRRPAKEGDERSYPSPIVRYFDDLEGTFRDYRPAVEREGNRATLKLVHKRDRKNTAEIAIDLERLVIEKVVHSYGGEKRSEQTASDFVELAGAFWPRLVEWKDGDGRVTSRTRCSYEQLAGDVFAEALGRSLAPLADAVLLELPLPKVEEAKQRALDGKATFADRWVLIRHFAATQRWEEVEERHAEAEALMEGTSGLDWIRLAVLKAARHNEDARQLMLRLARALAEKEAVGDFGLSEHLHRESSDILQDLERLELLTILKPVYERQDERLFPLKTWRIHRLQRLDSLGRSEAAFALRKELATSYPDDVGLQTSYSDALVRRGELDQALEHLERTRERSGPWTDGESWTLRRQAAYYLYDHRRLVEFLAYADRWLGGKPKGVEGRLLNRYLSALVMLDREVEADERIRAWLAVQPEQEIDEMARARLQAAIWHALGEGEDLHGRHVEERWHPLLATLARSFATDDERAWAADWIANNWRFRRTDAGAALRQELYRVLAKGVDALAPSVLERLFNWTRGYNPEDADVSRAEILRAVFSRWEKEKDLEDKGRLEGIVASRGGDLVLELRRKQIEEAESDEERATAAGRLFDLLISRPWTAEVERELLGLVGKLGAAENRTATQASAVRRLARHLREARAKALIEAIPDRNKKSRRELKPLEEAERRKAKVAVLETLSRFEDAAVEAELRPYVAIERLSLEAELEKDPARLSKELATLFSALPEPDAEKPHPMRNARSALAERCLILLGYLSTREEAHPERARDFLKLLDPAIEKESKKADAKLNKYRLLVALDRGDELEAVLRSWFEEAGEIAGNRWRVPFGYILAERNQVPAAIEVFESVEKRDELGAAEYRALANWYMVADRKRENREARIRAYQVSDEWQIRRSLQRDLARYRRTGDQVPEELDEEVLLRFAAVLRKSTRPQYHLNVLRTYYEVTKDFRLLETLSEAVVGQSAAKVYDVLRELDPLMKLIGDEATIDRLERHLEALHERGANEFDRRALRMLEFLVERRAADQTHGTAKHIESALRALREVFKGEWRPGEPALMARHLASAGRLVEPLRSEQLRQLEALHDQAAPSSENRFAIAVNRAAALWSNAVTPATSSLREQAIQVLDAALEERRRVHEGLLPQSAGSALSTYSRHLADVGEYRAAEQVWRRELALGYDEDRKRGFALELYDLYNGAIVAGADTALGSGGELYAAVRDEILAALSRRSHERHARRLVSRLCSIFQNARVKEIKGVAGDFRDFAFGKLPEVLRLYQYREGQNMVGNVADLLRDVVGPRESLAFLVTRAETEPGWIRRGDQDFWQPQGPRVARLRDSVRQLGDLEPRLLAIVLKEIRRDLTQRRSRHREMYHHRQRYFWRDKAQDFFRAAQGVLEERRDSEESVKHIAAYIYSGLARRAAAIDALFAYHRKHGLGKDGRARLVRYLQEQNRYPESVPLLLAMIEKWPGEVDYHARLMRAYFKTRQAEKLEAARRAADEYFRGERWQEGVMAKLGEICLETELFEHCVTYYSEAIPLRQKRSRNRGVGDGGLSEYYGKMGQALVKLGKTREAVDAAAGAIVVWGGHEDNRRKALEALEKILREARDLEAYVAQFEEDVAKTRLENPIVRKALGKVFLERKAFQKALVHLEAAVESRPEDKEIHELLIKTYDAAGDTQGAAARLLALARMRGHDFELYRQLGERWRKSGEAAGSERAYTSLAELSANESEGHALLAKVRETDRRWADAAQEWRQVIRIRTKEPAGYLGLSRALIGLGRREEARQELEKLLGKSWPAWFGDVHKEARELLKRVD